MSAVELVPAWPWPLTAEYPEPYPSRQIGGREVHPIITSLQTQGCWYGAWKGQPCGNAPKYLARYDCGDSDEEGLVCADHASEARLDQYLVEIRALVTDWQAKVRCPACDGLPTERGCAGVCVHPADLQPRVSPLPWFCACDPSTAIVYGEPCDYCGKVRQEPWRTRVSSINTTNGGTT